MLFIYMRNTKALLKLKMYGSHRTGKMIKELSLGYNTLQV